MNVSSLQVVSVIAHMNRIPLMGGGVLAILKSGPPCHAKKQPIEELLLCILGPVALAVFGKQDQLCHCPPDSWFCKS